MASVCKTWSMPYENIVGRCSSQYEPASGQNSCPVCARPLSATGPMGCCGCAATEEFPAIWNFDSPFTIGGDYGNPETDSYTGPDYPQLGNINPLEPVGTGYATATTTRYRNSLSEITGTSLVRAVSNSVPTCAWGYGEGRYDGWYSYPTYGAPAPSPGYCLLNAGFTEKRCEYSYAGPLVSGGNTTIGNIATACFWPSTTFNWDNVPDTDWNGTPLTSRIQYSTAPCLQYPNHTANGRLSVHGVCWNWNLRCIDVGGGVIKMALTLKSDGYSHTTLDRLIWVADPFVRYIHDYEVAPSSGIINTVWVGVYPCGNPDTITLTNSSPVGTGAMAGLTFPETITLRAVY